LTHSAACFTKGANPNDIGCQRAIATEDEPFGELLKALPHVQDSCADGIVVEPMTRKQFDPPAELKLDHSVVAEVLIALEATPNAEVKERFDEFVERFWKRTQGIWVPLTTVVTALDQRLGPDSRRPRLLTQNIIDDVFNQLDRVRKLW
jgi:hypothetical protein